MTAAFMEMKTGVGVWKGTGQVTVLAFVPVPIPKKKSRSKDNPDQRDDIAHSRTDAMSHSNLLLCSLLLLDNGWTFSSNSGTGS